MSEPGRRRGRPPRLLSGDTAARILDTARTLFAEHGFTVTTNRMVADAAGVTPTALYHYHASKLDLYAAVHDECRERLARRVDEIRLHLSAQAAALGVDGETGRA